MFTVNPISAQQTLLLRHEVLRPHQSMEECVYPGDEEKNSGHFGAFFSRELIGIASVYRQAPEDTEDAGAWRIRGMAISPDMQSRGAGQMLVFACGRHAKSLGGTWLWCNARQSARDFYAKLDFSIVGNAFDLPGIGPHYIMKRVIGPNKTTT